MADLKQMFVQSRKFNSRLLALQLTLINCLTVNCLAGDRLETGEAIPVGTDDKVGVLALPSISCSPLGSVAVSDRRRHDLFVVADRWHPAIYLYRWVKDDESGTPIFSQPIEITPPFKTAGSSPGYVLTDRSGNFVGFWLKSNKMVVASYDESNKRFDTQGEIEIEALPRNPSRLLVRFIDEGLLECFVTVGDGATYRPGKHRAKDYYPYDGAGIWRGELTRDGIYRFGCSWPTLPKKIIVKAELLSPNHGALFGISSLDWVKHGQSHQPFLLYGTKLGGIFTLANAWDDSQNSKSPQKRPIIDVRGSVLRHPTVGTNLTAFPSANGSRIDLIVAGEGGMYYYRAAKKSADHGEPIYESPRHVLQESADLYDGSLVVPNCVDWNGDGKIDIVAGNAAGQLLFFENQGTNQHPSFLPATYLEAGGEKVLVRGGYRGSIQGPGEAHWGYTCPTVVDWNLDGTLDIVLHDIRGIHTVYINRGTSAEPKLSLPQELNVESLELHGTWRTRPAAGMLGDRMAYVTLDDDDELHLYWRIDDTNLEDGGKLLLTSGKPIQANFLHAGGTGRGKFQFVDWDQDGATDLLVGTPRHSTYPEPEKGVPWSMDQAGSAVLLLKNTGSNEQPHYEYPAVMHVDGESMHFGQHSCAPYATSLGSEDGESLNILVGTELGRMIFFSGEDIEWKIIR